MLRDRLDSVIARDQAKIDAILDAYHVPRVTRIHAIASGGTK
jgi:hypothetical protein